MTNSTLTTAVGVIIVVALGVLALWGASFLLGFVWQHLWLIVGIVVGLLLVAFIIGALSSRRGDGDA